MPLEAFGFITDLNASNPVGATDQKLQGDDHIRGVKLTLQNSFPNVDAPMTLSSAQLNEAAIKNEANEFTANQTIKTAIPAFAIEDTSSPADEKHFDFVVVSGQLRARIRNDALSESWNWAVIDKAANSVSTLELYVGQNELALRAEANAGTRIYYDNTQRIVTQAGGIFSVRSDGNTDSETRRLVFEHAVGTDRAAIGHAGSGEFQIENFIHGSAVRITAEDVGGVEQSLFFADPDGLGRLYYDGAQSFQTALNGVQVADPFGNPQIDFYTINFAARRGQIRFTGTDAFFDNEVHGGRVFLTGENTGGTSTNLFIGDPDGSATMYYAGLARIQTLASGNMQLRADGNSTTESNRIIYEQANGTDKAYVGFFNANVFQVRNQQNGGSIQLRSDQAGGTDALLASGDPDGPFTMYENNVATLRTADRTAADKGTGAEVLDGAGTFRPVGLNVLPVDTTLSGGNDTLALSNVGFQLYYNSGTARTLSANADNDIPVGAAWSVIVGSSGGVLTLDGGTGITIQYWNGSGYSATAAAGNVTLGEGRHFIYKYSDSVFYVDGPNIS